MSSLKAQFCDLRPLSVSISGIGTASLEVCGIGTFAFDIEDDTSRRHTITIPDSLYVPDLQYTLLCLQYWAQTAPPQSVQMESDGQACYL